MCELSLKILTMAILLSCTAIVFYSWGKTQCELKERQEAIIMKAPNISVTAEGNSTIKAKVKDTFHNDDEDEDEAIVNKKGLTKGTHGPTKGEQNQDHEDQDDFTFEEDKDSDKEKDDKEKDTNDETTSFKPIIISFWPR